MNEVICKKKVLILQCDNGDENSNLLASARHLCDQSKLNYPSLHTVFVVNLKRVARGCKNLGCFHGVNWRCVHIDEIRPSSDDLPSLIRYASYNMSYIIENFCCNEASADLGKATENKRKLLLSILRRCIHSSVAQSVTSEHEGGSKTERIHFLLELISLDTQGKRSISYAH